MLAIRVLPTFIRIAKKLHPQEKKSLDQAVKKIANAPSLGEEKRGDLGSVFVYKFKIHRQEFLLAYELLPSKHHPKELVLLALGSHENFYRDLKR
ncbi:ParE-like toxin of type II toxin-antitoxin system [Polynucleobacter meluiroseus]|uniref:ParE-like toxin of type II toxin-antitoxin system n=1 Tax=Polynucleobacter meluiroseus TaxID=1938814 RepID=A0A240E3L6_9BURK|nr:type II toxin-antitoxin system RelE/ParE family toxin [Polynucleobacter meluiroseus]SNX29121.1 ParE-like toxin of type II toxin-antitoxin system [Polynucleobacter meluiroseus]